MSEIKFACPHCQQHIACASGYAGLSIDCPSCSGMMIVPSLSEVTNTPARTVLVAFRLPPRPRPSLVADVQEEAKWAQPCETTVSTEPTSSPPWLVAAIATVIIAAILKARMADTGWIVGCVVIGSILSGILAARSTRGSASGAYQILRAFTYSISVIILLPIVALGLLFAGCAACS